MGRRWGRFNPAQPRDRAGRWRKAGGSLGKGRASVRVSPRSVTAQYGYSIPVAPKTRVYVGALARVERTEPTELERRVRASAETALSNAIGRIGNERLRSAATGLANGSGVNIDGTRIATDRRRRAPRSIRATRNIGGVRATAGTRAPRRQPRQPRQRRAA